MFVLYASCTLPIDGPLHAGDSLQVVLIVRPPFIFHPNRGAAWLGEIFWEAMLFTGGVLSSVDMGYGEWGPLGRFADEDRVSLHAAASQDSRQHLVF